MITISENMMEFNDQWIDIMIKTSQNSGEDSHVYIGSIGMIVWWIVLDG